MKIDVVFKLPDNDEMMERLLEIGATQDLRKRFFPLLIQHAGEEVSPQKVVEILVVAIEKYTQTMPEGTARSIKRLMYASAGWFVRALIDDKNAAAEIRKQFILMLDTF